MHRPTQVSPVIAIDRRSQYGHSFAVLYFCTEKLDEELTKPA